MDDDDDDERAPAGARDQDGPAIRRPTTPDDPRETAGPDDAPPASPPSAADELQEAFGHLRSAARRLVEDAAKDPALRSATAEAERVLQDLGQRAEPLARQMGEEIGRWSRRFSDLVQSTVDDLSASRTPGSPRSDDDPDEPGAKADGDDGGDRDSSDDDTPPGQRGL